MKTKIIITVILCLQMAAAANAQDYIQYQRYFNKIDLDVKKKDFGNAVSRLDTVERNYDFIFSKHCMMALQICCSYEDSIRAERWLSRCFRGGVPAWIIRQNIITEKTLHYANTKPVWDRYDSLHTAYKMSVDTALAKQIAQLMERDMRYTNKVNHGSLIMYPVHGIKWIHNNTKVHRELKSIIELRGFPGERMIGLDPKIEDSVAYCKLVQNSGIANQLCEGQAFFLLLHYFSTKRNHINPLLFKSVLTGDLPVEYYARISDYHHSESKHRKRDACYYSINTPQKEDLNVINDRRAKIGLMSLEQQKENKDLYWTRLRAGTINKEIIYE